eukprot:CAMPEP_0176484524 /NCGR_PEP_ID=MMETSP0200_2-20121128/4503_1 /TAXON_ID=947934 /ORGANISM="Chaetoceros sp., Strain GSL56" /LENGTH=865 /DNA_ID=CAMNT_0017881009 /DNA_START=61 /DNA_END=2658 /DNA_ORIENTATION=+
MEVTNQDDSSTMDEQRQVASGIYPDYTEDQELFEKFVKEHEILTTTPEAQDEALLEPGTVENVYRINCYKSLLQRIKNRQFYNELNIKTFMIEVPLDEIVAWDNVRGLELANRATGNTIRYISLFCQVFDRILGSMDVTNQDDYYSHRDSIDVLHEQRLQQQELRREQEQQRQMQEEQEGNLAADLAMRETGVTDEFPPVLMRRYELRILPLDRKGILPPFQYQYRGMVGGGIGDEIQKNSALTGVSLRHIRSQSMGKLVTIRGMIVRASDVKPCCVVATYTCDNCGCEMYQVVQNKREFMPQRICYSARCRRQGGVRDTVHLQTRGSKFEKFQELKIQELPSQVPMGHIPRSMSVHCRGELTRQATPGDVVTIDGIFLPQRVAESGYRAMKAGLISMTFLEAQHIIVHKKSYDDSIADSLSEEAKAKLDNEIMEIATGEDPVGRLSSSIAPEIYGHEDIKRALLLQLVSGCTRKLPDGMRIRGDINICLMGDPGVAKSQMLKHVSSTAPRGVYTTGKGSSGVGLTAAITKDLTTGEMALEGGALVLADQGICAIDEFDKMDEADRTAIHEVMEQQTVSVAKAGIVATLNARAAVLAAANPLYGRYNRKKSLSENVNLPNSLLSRFDLMFLILDVADVDKDMALARHVTFVHQNEGLTAKRQSDVDSDDSEDEDMNDINGGASESKTVPPEIVREYISRARKHQPVVRPDVAPYIVEAYVGLRMQGIPGSNSRKKQFGDQMTMTARQLLSILRLSQALARLRFSDFVAREDVDEAIRLTHMSKASLEDNYEGKGEGQKDDVISRIYTILRDYSTASRTKRIELKLCEAMVLRKGFTKQQLQTCLEEYQTLNILLVNKSATHVVFF